MILFTAKSGKIVCHAGLPVRFPVLMASTKGAGQFAYAYNGKKEYYVTPSKEMDFIITVRNKAVLIGEVKWGKYDSNDVKKFVEKSAFIKAEKIFITQNKTETKMDKIKIMDVDDILAMVK